MTNTTSTANPPHPALPPSARFSRSTYCGGRDLSLPIADNRGLRSADRRRVLDSPLAPEVVEAARDLELGAGADIAVKGFAVIADRLDDLGEPVLGQPKLLAEIAVGAEGAFQIRLVRFRHLVGV